eukprot:286782_1
MLIETVNCFGTSVRESIIPVYYHGVSQVYFTSFYAEFNSPTSTTTKLSIAAIFAKNNGIILELQQTSVYASSSSYLRYFNCSLISCFGYEEERLFIQPPNYRCLEFNSIRNLSTDENYKQFIDALSLFEMVITNTNLYNKTISKTSVSIIKTLLSKHMFKCSGDSNCPVYILKTFQKWSDHRKSVNINFNYLKNQNGLMEVVELLMHKTIKNLPLLYRITLVFKNVEIIKFHATKSYNVSEEYFLWILVMIKNINKCKISSDLKQIRLWDMKLSNEIHKKYAPLFMLEGWKLNNYGGICVEKTKPKKKEPKKKKKKK